MSPLANERCQTRRRFLIDVSGLLAAVSSSFLIAQERNRGVRRIGFINGDPSMIAPFKAGLRTLGYVEGENLSLDARLVSGPEVRKHATELATGDFELVVAGALPYALEIRRANPAMRMVIATCPGMISNGFANTLDRPGGNLTGIDELPPGVTAKRLTLLKTVAPSISRVALLSTTPGTGGHEAQLADAEQVAPALKISVKAYRASSLPELEAALASMAGDGMQGFANFQGGLSLRYRQVIADFAKMHRLPAVYQATMFAEAGGLMAWAPDLAEQYRIAADYVDLILKGADPGDLPIRHPARYFWTVNQTAARCIGLTLSPSVLAQVDRVIP